MKGSRQICLWSSKVRLSALENANLWFLPGRWDQSWDEQTGSKYLHSDERDAWWSHLPFDLEQSGIYFTSLKACFQFARSKNSHSNDVKGREMDGGWWLTPLLLSIMLLSACYGIFMPPAAWALRVRARSLFGAAVHEPCPLQRYVLQPAQMAWKKAWAVETNPGHLPEGSLGDIMVKLTQCSHSQTPALLPAFLQIWNWKTFLKL